MLNAKFDPNDFHKNAKIYNLHKKRKSTIFMSNLKFVSSNLHLKQVSSLQSTGVNGLQRDLQSTICPLVYKQNLGQIYNLIAVNPTFYTGRI